MCKKEVEVEVNSEGLIRGGDERKDVTSRRNSTSKNTWQECLAHIQEESSLDSLDVREVQGSMVGSEDKSRQWEPLKVSRKGDPMIIVNLYLKE